MYFFFFSDVENLSLNSSQEPKKHDNDDLFQFICCLLLKHITQLVCNGHAIYEVGNW